MSRSRREIEAAVVRRRPALAFAALFAVLLQAFVIQTHIHAPAAPLGVAFERTVEAGEHVSAADEHQAFACVVCQTLANAGAMLAAPVNGVVTAETIAEAATYVLPRAPPIPAHPWQSRAPPTVLQA